MSKKKETKKPIEIETEIETESENFVRIVGEVPESLKAEIFKQSVLQNKDVKDLVCEALTNEFKKT